jgi:hypothetical protein
MRSPGGLKLDSPALKYLYKRIKNKIKPQTANTFVDKNNAIFSNKQIANEFKKYFETIYSSSIKVDESQVSQPQKIPVRFRLCSCSENSLFQNLSPKTGFFQCKCCL